MKVQENKDFLQLQRKPCRPGCMMDIDMKLAGIEQRKLIGNEIKNLKSMAVLETSLTGILY